MTVRAATSTASEIRDPTALHPARSARPPRPAPRRTFPSSSRRTLFGVSTVRGRADAFSRPDALARPSSHFVIPANRTRRPAVSWSTRCASAGFARAPSPSRGASGGTTRPPAGKCGCATPAASDGARPDDATRTRSRNAATIATPSTPTPRSFPNPTRLPRAPDLLPERLETPRESARVKTNTRTPSRTVDTHPPSSRRRRTPRARAREAASRAAARADANANGPPVSTTSIRERLFSSETKTRPSVRTRVEVEPEGERSAAETFRPTKKNRKRSSSPRFVGFRFDPEANPDSRGARVVRVCLEDALGGDSVVAVGRTPPGSARYFRYVADDAAPGRIPAARLCPRTA